MDLATLAQRYGVDKWFSHSYIPFYEQLFKDREVNRLLEIGIGYEQLMKDFVPFYIRGASLRMWADFFPEAEIYGCDIRPDTMINFGRIHTTTCDQSNPIQLVAMVESFGGQPFDVIIDDGSHETAHQITSANFLLPFVTDGGVYVIEDVQQPELVVTGIGSGTIHRFNKRPDDCLVVIQK